MIQFDYEEQPVQVTAAGDVTIATRDSARAVDFYRWVFGFRLAPGPDDGGTPRILMLGRRGTCLAICEQRGAPAAPKRLLFETVDLDDARERLWELGVALADGSIEPRFDAQRCCRWLGVRDPDGNEIELVETPRAAASPHAGRAREISTVTR